MLRDRFFDLVESARPADGSRQASADPEVLGEVLALLDLQELREFVLAFDDELVRLNRWSVWGAGYVAAGGMSDDGFRYFRCWLIGKGREAVDAVLADGDSLSGFLDDSGLENEELEYVGADLLIEHGLSDPRDDGHREDPDGDPVGEPFDEDAVEATYPRIAASARR